MRGRCFQCSLDGRPIEYSSNDVDESERVVDLLFIGDHPTASEYETGSLLVGPIRKVVNQILRDCNCITFGATNLVQCVPEDDGLQQKDILCCSAAFKTNIDTVQYRAMLVYGKIAERHTRGMPRVLITHPFFFVKEGTKCAIYRRMITAIREAIGEPEEL